MDSTHRILFLADINSIHTEKWVRSLTKRGYQIALFSLSVKTCTWPDELKIPYQCFDMSEESVRSSKRFGKASYFKAIHALRPLLESFDPHIVHAHYASSYGMLATKLSFPQSVISLWGSDIYEFPKRSILHKFLIKKILRKAPVVCSTSKAMAVEASKYIKRKYEVTPFGIDVDRFQYNSEEHEVYTIGTVKSLEHIYGVDRLIKAYAAYQKTSEIKSCLKIYGSGSEKEKLQKLVDSLGISDHVGFEGFVSGNQLVAAFNSLDVYVALSRRESFGVAVLEAESSGLPVITSDAGGLPEVVDPESGYVLSGELIQETAIILKQLEDREERRKRGVSARQFVINNFSEDACVDKLIKVYDQFK